FNVQPQMVEGHTIEDGRIWNLRLRPGLMFHDGTPVLAGDVIASMRRWASRASFGQTMMDAADAVEAADDRSVRLRMKRSFPVSLALANSALIMPARLAATDSATQVTEMVGSGPFRFLASERVAGATAAYAKFDGYVPRPDGLASFTAGPKIAYVDRVEWHVIPDPATAASAMLAGEMDWWEASPDYLPQLRKSSKVRLQNIDPLGGIRVMRFNHLTPPFNNPAIRRALLPVIDQAEVMSAYTEDRSLWRDGVGTFTPGTPMANDAGLEVLTGKRDLARAKAELEAAGYKGERVVVLHPADQPEVSSNTLVGVDMAKRIGLNIDLQTMDWGTLIGRRAKMVPASEGGWNMVFTGLTGSQTMDPSVHIALRGNGVKAWAGWPTMPRIEELRTAWLDAPDLAAQKAICVEIQKQFWVDVPYIPLGQTTGINGFNVRVTDVPVGAPLFYGLKLV
ncbi:MAG TPA: ABC transporter substrate-binding protein, partial [Acetobacteraceae bacterium]|nr:ABC transporter substrate-binding protein [Acetobacteraceae bacterium]